MGIGLNNNTSTTTSTSRIATLNGRSSGFHNQPSKTTPSTTTQSKWAAAATPTAPARAAPVLRAPAPAANKPILSPTDLRYHRPLAPQCYRITSAFTIFLFTRETCVNENFFGGVTRHHGLQGWIEGRLDEDTRLKMGGQRKLFWFTKMNGESG